MDKLNRIDLVVFYVLVSIIAAISAKNSVLTQRTYKRHCDCEYMIDGKCAYTLLLPSMTGSSGQNCPESEQKNSEKSDNSDKSDLDEQVNINSKLLLRLQFMLLQQQDAIHTAMNNSFGSEYMEEIRKMMTIGSNMGNAGNIMANLTTIIQQGMNAAQSQFESFKNILEAQQRASTSLEQKFNSLKQDFDTLKKASKGCKKLIPINQGNMIASSSHNDSFGANSGRLGSKSSWCSAEPAQQQEWLEYSFASAVKVCGIITKGRGDFDQWVTSYSVMYGESTDKLIHYSDIPELESRQSDSDTASEFKLRLKLVHES